MNRLMRYIASQINRHAPSDTPKGPVRFEFTDRGLALINDWLARHAVKADGDEPIQRMVQTPGWKKIEAELVHEIQELSLTALKKMTSPLLAEREEAMVSALVVKVLNEHILQRVNRRLLDAMIVADVAESLEKMRNEHARLVGQEGTMK